MQLVFEYSLKVNLTTKQEQTHDVHKIFMTITIMTILFVLILLKGFNKNYSILKFKIHDTFI